MPGSQGTQAWDRYAYVNNNPVRYTDPSGHALDAGCQTVGCGTYKPKPINLDFPTTNSPDISNSSSSDTLTTPAGNHAPNISLDDSSPPSLFEMFEPQDRCDAYDSFVDGPEEIFTTGNFHFESDHGWVSAHLGYQASYGTNFYDTYSIVTIDETFELYIQAAHSPSAETYATIFAGGKTVPIFLGPMSATYPGPKQSRSQKMVVFSSSPVEAIMIEVVTYVIGVKSPSSNWYILNP